MPPAKWRHRPETARAPLRFLFSECAMEQRTRDNLVYLIAGLGAAALVVADFLYGESHGQGMWTPSRFATRLVGSAGIVAYFVGQATRKEGATPIQVVALTLVGIMIEVLLVSGFRQDVATLPTLTFSGLFAVQAFLVVRLLSRTVRFINLK